VLNQLISEPEMDKSDLEQNSQAMAQRLGRLHGINAPEFFDKGVFAFMLSTLKEEGYLIQEGGCDTEKAHQLAEQLSALLPTDVKLTIQESISAGS
jgi:glycerol-3-phosphate O-acyltransferase